MMNRTDGSQPQQAGSIEELIQLGCDFFRKLNDILDTETAETIAKRVRLLAKAKFYPETGYGDLYAMAAFMNMGRVSVMQQAARNGVPDAMPGDSKLYRFSDFFKHAPKRAKNRVPQKKTEEEL